MGTVARAAITFATTVLALYAALLAVIYFESDKLVFPGAGAAVQHVNPAAAFPGAEDVNIPVDGATFAHAWWIPSRTGTQQTLLCFHGNGYALEDELTREAPALYESGANLLLVDYRGYGTSSKLATSPETTAADARAAFRYLTDQRHIAPPNIWIFGRSIGASIAVRLATETTNAGGVILLTPITNTADVEPYRKLVKPLGWLGLTKVWSSLARMPQVHVPVTIIAGSLDTLAPPWMAHALYDAANHPKSLKMIDGADHNDILAVAGRTVSDEIERALEPPELPNLSRRGSANAVPTATELLVRRYFSMVEAGDLLSPEGWKRVSALFTSAKPYAAQSDIALVTAPGLIAEDANNGTIARVETKWGDSFGTVDGQLVWHSPLPQVPDGDSIGMLINFDVEYVDKHLELDDTGHVTSETSGPREWKLKGPLQGRMATPKAAIAYAQYLRDTTNDPRLRRAAEKAIRKMNNLHVNCAC